MRYNTITNLLLSFLLTCLSLQLLGARVDTVEVYSQSMQKTLPSGIVLPDSYAQQKNTAYPVLYLLHGGSGSFRDWLTKTPDTLLLQRLSDQYDLIIVTPEGGSRSYYFDSPLDKSSQYETFITRELVAFIDKNYRTIPERRGRVIAGLSMGGHGAMYLSTLHPELYCAAGSMSGVMNINTAKWKVPAEFAQSRADNFAQLLGPPRDAANPYPEYTMAGMTNQLKNNGVRLIFDCGVDDFLIETNRELHQQLLDKQIPHEYTERPGEHTWEYWENALPYQVLFFSKILRN